MYIPTSKPLVFVNYLEKTLPYQNPDFIIAHGIRGYDEAKGLQKIHFQFIKIGYKPFWNDIPSLYDIIIPKKPTSYTPLYKDMEIILYRILEDLEIEV